MNPIFWLIVFVVLVVIEIATMALTTVWFAGGDVVAFLLSLFHMTIEVGFDPPASAPQVL